MSKQYNSFIPPGLTTINGKRYVVPGYHEVPFDTKLEDVHKNWERLTNTKPISDDITVKVKSTDGKSEYTVECKSNRWSCTCPSFGFRKDCKHINLLKKQKI